MPEYFTITNGDSAVNFSSAFYGQPLLYGQGYQTYSNIDSSVFRETKHLWGAGFIYSDEPIKPKHKRLKFDEPEKEPNWQ